VTDPTDLLQQLILSCPRRGVTAGSHRLTRSWATVLWTLPWEGSAGPERTIAKLSRQGAARVERMPGFEERHVEADGYVIGVGVVRAACQLHADVRGLPDDLCQSHHWGYVTQGRMISIDPRATRCSRGRGLLRGAWPYGRDGTTRNPSGRVQPERRVRPDDGCLGQEPPGVGFLTRADAPGSPRGHRCKARMRSRRSPDLAMVGRSKRCDDRRHSRLVDSTLPIGRMGRAARSRLGSSSSRLRERAGEQGDGGVPGWPGPGPVVAVRHPRCGRGLGARLHRLPSSWSGRTCGACGPPPVP
jgi:hypothetical protein